MPRKEKDRLNKLGLGVLDGLQALDKLKGQIAIEDSESKEVKEEKSKRVNKQESKGVNEQKSKRSFMLTDKQIEMVYLLKSKYKDKDLSAIVGEAIEEYYKKYM